jgi:hypothetical protein
MSVYLKYECKVGGMIKGGRLRGGYIGEVMLMGGYLRVINSTKPA